MEILCNKVAENLTLEKMAVCMCYYAVFIRIWEIILRASFVPVMIHTPAAHFPHQKLLGLS